MAPSESGEGGAHVLPPLSFKEKGMPKKPYKVEGVSACGARFTIAKCETSQEARRFAELHRHCTGRRPQILFRGRLQAY